MPGTRIKDLTALPGAGSANDDDLVIFDADADETKRISRSQLAAGLVGDLPYTPSGGISATTVPTAIAELDTEKQPLDAGLTSIAGLTTAADKMVYTTAADVYAVASLTAAGRAILDDADTAAQRVTLGLEIGVDIQAFDADTAKTDAAQTFTAAQRGQVTTLTSAASITINFALSNNFILTTGHAAILFANPTTEVAGQSGSIFIVQGSTTCAAPTWGNQWYFAGGTAPALTGTTGKCARIDYIVQAAGKIHAVATDNLTYTS